LDEYFAGLSKKYKLNNKQAEKEIDKNFLKLILVKNNKLLKLIISCSTIGLYILISLNSDYQL